MLEWFCPSFSTGVIGAGTFFVILVLYLTFRDSGFGWMVHWHLWAIIAGCMTLPFLITRSTKLSAGSDWLMSGKGFIKTYELVSIRVSIGSGGAAHILSLIDKENREMRLQLLDLQSNPKLWDLVYNGILHSIYHNNAKVNKRANTYLLLDLPDSRVSGN